ncbi:phosphoglucosamine mutase [Bacillus mexicanus]|uniref:phosphoglucosamine mutase n=1 Tax=Bacillus mexicanus TaxID=2834415 RepID=UPI003D22744E
MRKYFGTDGVRGIANKDLTPELAYKLGKSAGYVLTKNFKANSTLKKKPVFVIGKDTRISGPMLEYALISGLTSSGVDVIQLGIIPTPGVAFLTKQIADGGAMISASHNPFEDNGIKFFNSNGFKLADEIELQIEYFLENINELPNPTNDNIGMTISNKDAANLYIKFLKDTIDQSFEHLKIVLDCSNGAASTIAPTLFKSLCADVYTYSANPDGTNINSGCGSTHPDFLREKVLEHNADIGLAFDGDADRLIAVDELGNIIDGDQILYLCAKSLSLKGKLSNNTVVSTVMSNFGFKKALKKIGVNTVETKVGDRYVLEEMIKGRHCLGGEQSGHIIFSDYNTTGDGILSALQLINVLKESSSSLSELLGDFKKYPQELANIRVNNKKAWENSPSVNKAIQKAEETLSGNGRVLVRASGTENLIRVMVEGENLKLVQELTGSIAKEIKNIS